MTNQQAEEIFNQAIKNATTAEQIAKVELLKEYFTNPEFRDAMSEYLFNIQDQ